MTDKMREAFESRFPIPDGVAWKESGNYGAIARGQRVLLSASSYRAMWEAWQAAQSVPAADEPRTLMTDDEAKAWAWKTLKADLEPRNWTAGEQQ